MIYYCKEISLIQATAQNLFEYYPGVIMQFSILLDIFNELLLKRHLTASYLAQKYEIAPRTVYRYVSVLAQALPLSVQRGRNGGIYLSDTYTLPLQFLTEEEYESVVEALASAYTQTNEERFLSAKRKLHATKQEECREKAFNADMVTLFYEENFLNLPKSEWEKLRITESCVRDDLLLEIEYCNGEKQCLSRIEPHLILFRENRPFTYAFCHSQRKFRLFALGELRTLKRTDEHFRKRPFPKEAVSSSKAQKLLPVRLELLQKTPSLLEWLGTENVREYKGKEIADLLLPDNERLLSNLLQFGKDIKILSPLSLQEKLKIFLADIHTIYE